VVVRLIGKPRPATNTAERFSRSTHHQSPPPLPSQHTHTHAHTRTHTRTHTHVINRRPPLSARRHRRRLHAAGPTHHRAARGRRRRRRRQRSSARCGAVDAAGAQPGCGEGSRRAEQEVSERGAGFLAGGWLLVNAGLDLGFSLGLRAALRGL